MISFLPIKTICRISLCAGAISLTALSASAQDSDADRLAASYAPAPSSYRAASSALWQAARVGTFQELEDFKKDNDEATSKLQLQQSLQMAVAADPLLGEVHGFRQTLLGTGTRSLRRWSLSGSGDGAINLELGKHNLPGFSLAGLSGSQSSVGIGGQKFGLYSSAPMRSLNKSLAAYDNTLGLGNAASLDATEMTWLQLQPLKSKSADLQMIWAMGQRDLSPGSQTNDLLQGNLWGVQGNYKLPFLAKWQLNGQWVKSNVGHSRGATAWQAKATGPISHPLGTAQVSAVYTDIESNFESFAGSSLEDGRITKTLAITQPVGSGRLTGKLGLSWNLIDRDAHSHTNLPQSDHTFNGLFNLRWQLASNFALTTTHSLTKNTTELYPGSDLRISDRYDTDSKAGIELKITPSVSFNLDAGTKSNQIYQQYLSGSETPSVDQNFNYMTVGLHNKRGSGSMGIDVQRDASTDAVAAADRNNVIVSVGAQQTLTEWLSVGGNLKLSDSSELQTVSGLLSKPADLSANAKISLSSLGALQLSYSQWDVQHALDANGEDSRNAYQLSYLLGAASSGKSGVGLSFSYSHAVTDAPQNSMWKVGLTYR